MPRRIETAALTLVALVAFAANSILTRRALGGGAIDAASFTSVRLASGALVLCALVSLRAGRWWPSRQGGLVAPLALFFYAAPFSFAYLRIGAAVGALVLFGTVQITMIGWGVVRGERPGGRATVGLILAAGALAALTIPSVSRPDPLGTVMMVVAGAAWGIYSLAGRGVHEPLASNARSFVLAVPPALLLTTVTLRSAVATPRGLALAAVSGAVTSGLGYAIWYRALRGLTPTQAAIVQLSVPIIAALGAVAFLGESLTGRLVVCGGVALAGVALALGQGGRG